jgi:tripartite-type tricarboxylate transporter receptor subunit TctC
MGGNNNMPRVLAGLMIFAACLCSSGGAIAQDYPTRPVRIIIPLGPGGGGDVFIRAVADELQKALGQPFLVENRPGGGLNIGTRACAEAAPDGYTFCILSSEPITYNQFLFKSIPYDPEKDLQPIVNLFFNTLAVVINSETKVKSIAEMIALAKARPGSLSYATFSFPLTHFMEKINKTERVDIVKVPYRGGGEVVNAVLANTTPIALLALSNMVPQVQSGRITALAVNARSRSPLFPDVPTLAEARNGEDYPPTWFGLFTPSGVPHPIVAKIASEVDRIVTEPSFRKRMFTDRAVEPATERLDGFARFIREERKFAEQIVKESGQEPK